MTFCRLYMRSGHVRIPLENSEGQTEMINVIFAFIACCCWWRSASRRRTVLLARADGLPTCPISLMSEGGGGMDEEEDFTAGFSFAMLRCVVTSCSPGRAPDDTYMPLAGRA